MEKENKEKKRKLAKEILLRRRLNNLVDKYSKKYSQNQEHDLVNTEQLCEIVTNKLKMLHCPITSKESLLPQLMLAVFSPETPDNLPITLYDREEIFQEVISLLRYSDKTVAEMLELDMDKKDKLARVLRSTKTAAEIRQILIMETLYESMSNNLDQFPNKNHLRIIPSEKKRKEAFI